MPNVIDDQHTKLRTYYSNSLSRHDNLHSFFTEQSLDTKDEVYDFYRAGGARLALKDLESSYWSSFTGSPLTLISWLDAYWASGPNFLDSNPVDNTAISFWAGEGTRNTLLSQLTGANQPIYKLVSNINSKPAIRFDGTNDLLRSDAWTAIPSPYTIVSIFKLNTLTQGLMSIPYDGRVTTNRAVLATLTTATPDSWWIYQGSGAVAAGTADTSPHLAIVTYDATDTLELDNTLIVSGNAGTHSLDGVTLAAAFDNTFPTAMDFAFWGVINRTLTPSEKASLRLFSQAYYATS